MCLFRFSLHLHQPMILHASFGCFPAFNNFAASAAYPLEANSLHLFSAVGKMKHIPSTRLYKKRDYFYESRIKAFLQSRKRSLCDFVRTQIEESKSFDRVSQFGTNVTILKVHSRYKAPNEESQHNGNKNNLHFHLIQLFNFFFIEASFFQTTDERRKGSKRSQIN